MKMSETDVVLSFAFLLYRCSVGLENIEIELPKGSWQGNKNRDKQGDIRGLIGFGPIEAKGNFNTSKKDFINKEKNPDVTDIIYATKDKSSARQEKKYWKTHSSLSSVLAYLESEDRFVCLKTDSQEKLKIFGERVEVFG